MSDYLNNLVARTLSLAPVVQPRVGSLFEPVSASSANVSSASFVSQTTSEASLERQEINGDSLAPDHPARVAAPLVVPGPNPPETHRRTFAASATSETESVNSSGAINDHQSWPQPRVRPLIDRQLADGQPTHSKDREPAETSLIIRPQVSISADAAKRPDSIRVVPARSFHEKPPAEGPETITVTIGRVDVRAVFSTPPSPRVNRAQPRAPMSLDEYLKKRNEGHR